MSDRRNSMQFFFQFIYIKYFEKYDTFCLSLFLFFYTQLIKKKCNYKTESGKIMTHEN